MKFVALVSGGKDSIYALMESIRHGHELVGCVHLAAPHSNRSAPSSSDDEEEESYMYQTAASEVLATVVEECLGVPLIWHRRVGTSVNTSLVYQQAMTTTTTTTTTTTDEPQPHELELQPQTTSLKKDEVEDLYEALQTAQERFPGLEAVSSGAILSTYQRVRIEHVCGRLGLTSLSYLWRRAPQDAILRDMIHQNFIHAVLVKTACPPGLIPRQHLNKSILELEPYFYQLHDKYQFHVCGEGGEYETIVLDCPIYQRTLVLDEVEMIETDDGVGVLSIRQWHTEPKKTTNDTTTWMETANNVPAKQEATVATVTTSAPTAEGNDHSLSSQVISYLPHVQKLSGGLLHFSEVMSPVAAESDQPEADAAVQEALAVFQLLGRALKRNGATPQDVVLVHLYLSEISHFALINGHYRTFFGTFLPPSRSCVAIGKRVLPGGRRVLLDCIVQCGSGEYLRAPTTGSANDNAVNNNNKTALSLRYAKAAQLNTTSKLREVLHVQSISHWAPTCVGPYSQANTVRSGLVFLAGQIGLIPTTMKLHNTWRLQLQQCWRNVANVLDALQGSSLDHMLSCLVYVSTKVVEEEKSACWEAVEGLSYQHITTNSGVIPGAIESNIKNALKFDGYEDENTMLELKKNNVEKPDFPLLLISIPEMPMGALVEVEVVAATQRAASCLAFAQYSGTVQNSNNPEKEREQQIQWNTGYDFGSPRFGGNENVYVNITSRFLGKECPASVIITANAPTDQDLSDISADGLLDDMLYALDKFFLEADSGLSIRAAWHVRLYYIGATLTNDEICDDGTRLRSALACQIASRWPWSTPATSVIPVRAMKLSTNKIVDHHTFLAMHIILADPVHLETEMWIRHGTNST
jgi:diphthine-ammonia ligase